MNQKFLYITRKDCAQANPHRVNHHWLELPDGRVLMSVEFVDEPHKDAFERTAATEPVAQDEPISAAHAAILAHLGVQAGDTAKVARKKLKAIHGLL
ncbi:MAG: hypothetical protein WBF09_05085 [Candidatus Acidiferrum sp.]